MPWLSVIAGCMRLYRADVAAIAFLAFQAGSILAGNRPTLPALLFGSLISGISMNFVYSINSVLDRQIDAINKPRRPLAAGTLSLMVASQYCQLLLVLSFILPLLVTHRPVVLVCAWALPVLGWLYSCPPARLRRWKVPSLFVVATAHHLPVLTSFYWVRTDQPAPPALLALTFLFALAIIPLKDIQDQGGDTAFAVENWAAVLGIQRLLWYSITLLAVNLLLMSRVPLPPEAGRFLLLLQVIVIALLVRALRVPAFAQAVYARILQAIGAVFLCFVFWPR